MTTGPHHSLAVGLLILSDRCSAGQSEDLSGPALQEFLEARQAEVAALEILPDDREVIIARLRSWVEAGKFDLILTCGGTGLAARDVTPEATRAVLELELPGFGERMRAAGLAQTPRAIISRAVAGASGRSLIINLPGRPAAALQSLAAVWEAVPHAVAKLQEN